ncbi:MAG: DNA double-strand break repair nuclease NurA [Pyrinomonadaceae bacterium]
MSFRDFINKELDDKLAEFRVHRERHAKSAAELLALLSRLAETPYADIQRRFEDAENIGAFPASEIESSRSFVFPFGISWLNHERARCWAAEILDDRTTFAADGSQIYAGRETSVPVAMIQIGGFENPHNTEKTYEKTSRVEILSPADLFLDQEEPMNPDVRVEERRYLGEVAAIGDFLRKKKDWQSRGERMPLAFFDNPLLVPFSQKGLQKSLLEATVHLVRLSGETEVPLVGFVDRSFSRDLITMLAAFDPAVDTSEGSVYDSWLLSSSAPEKLPVLSSWGDRTCYCYSKRRGLNAFNDAVTGRSTVGFSYLQTTAHSAPARLDIPAWVYEQGLLGELIDVVRAECVIGLGYPYPLETADQTAVISGRDREVFFRALQELATREKLDFSVARKDTSKARRR